MDLCFYALLTDVLIKKDRAWIRCDEDFVALTKQATFWRTGVKITGTDLIEREIVGVQLESDVVEELLRSTGTTTTLDALVVLESLGLADFYLCKIGEEESKLFVMYPELAGTHQVEIDGDIVHVPNFPKWGGVM